MKHSLSAALLLSLALATPGLAAKKKKPAEPSTLPPTSPMLVVPAPDSTDSNSNKLISSEMSGRDLEFFTKVSDAGREEAYFVDLLKKSASSDVIKRLADALNAAQAEENMHIAKLASQKGWSLSLAPTAEQKKAGEEIAKLSGSNLDKAAMDRVVAASNEALGAYQEATHSSDIQIKTFAAQMIPLAEEKRHLVEKMTGAGAKAANQLFRHGSAPPTVAPESSESIPTEKDAPAEREKSASEPTVKASAKPEGKDTLSSPKTVGLPIATPPGGSTPPPILPPIVPPQLPATPAAK
ncbi:hypothetical protein CfE428DRAFT_1086 [Chthoniobacter flavus Ellin428]|uniref:DUF4142 domain-containing protein n=1 Tax=Chthoniobacter flavus Ellin428 TaxID=497964 RepID=B4CWP8_9BACT|nr:DUF4142 domain-containing protein [Chthoniobacter flavus]EDY21840.1 hypothetical protein CfE428DRAFT_1086 [Chthoniobacter flavus Ellin428]TCO95767.1 uncharacterized protein DUF4142 [Chthoniobacter flavus]